MNYHRTIWYQSIFHHESHLVHFHLGGPPRICRQPHISWITRLLHCQIWYSIRSYDKKADLTKKKKNSLLSISENDLQMVEFPIVPMSFGYWYQLDSWVFRTPTVVLHPVPKRPEDRSSGAAVASLRCCDARRRKKIAIDPPEVPRKMHVSRCLTP